jgi:hypothetical protein
MKTRPLIGECFSRPAIKVTGKIESGVMKTTRKNYRDMHGYCCAHIDDRHKCVNFKLVELTYNCCKYMLVSGECDFTPGWKFGNRHAGSHANPTGNTASTKINEQRTMIDKRDIGGGTGMNKPEKPAQPERNGLLTVLWCPICKANVPVDEKKCPQDCPVCGTEIQAEWQ